MSKQPEQLSPDVLRQFTGTENWYRHAHQPQSACSRTAQSMWPIAAALTGCSTKSPSPASRQSRQGRAISGLDAESRHRAAHRHAHLRGRQRQQGVREGARIYRLPHSRNHALVHRQHHPSCRANTEGHRHDSPQIHRDRRQAPSLAQHREVAAGPNSCRSRSSTCAAAALRTARGFSPDHRTLSRHPVISNLRCFPECRREPPRDGSLWFFPPAFQPTGVKP